MIEHAPMVSVVVPVFRTEPYLRACLASLLGQTLTDFEVIVVDDASPGDVAGTLAMAAAGDPRVRLVRHEANRGVAQARNTGARTARGRYLAFVDADDEVDHRFLEMMSFAATRHGADFVQCGMDVLEPDGTRFEVNRGGVAYVLPTADILPALLAGRMSNSLGNKLMAADLFLAVIDDLEEPLSRVSFGEDLLISFTLACRANGFAHLPDPLYRYLRRATSVSLTEDADRLARNIESLGLVYERVRAVLAGRTEPPARVHAFFEREFVVPVVNHFWRARDTGTGAPPGLPASLASLGLLGALVAHGLFLDDVPPGEP